MAARKNTVRDEIIDLAVKGIRPTVIAERLGVRKSRVGHIVCQARRDGAPIPWFKCRNIREPATQLQVIVPIRVKDSLAAAAATRGFTVNQIVVTLLELVTSDDMIDAILDDADEQP